MFFNRRLGQSGRRYIVVLHSKVIFKLTMLKLVCCYLFWHAIHNRPACLVTRELRGGEATMCSYG